jgi:hypothetical protein
VFYWIYDFSSLSLALIFSAACLTFAWLGLVVSRPVVRRLMGPEPGRNDLVSYFLSAYGVFYGLMLGLIAVVTYQNYSEVDHSVVREASTLGALYRDISTYPEPLRGKLQSQLREYARFVIEESWPMQKRGINPEGGRRRVTTFQLDLCSFKPSDRSEEILHAEAIRQFNNFIEARRVRLHNVTTGLPAVMWWVVVIGAALNISILWLFSVDRLAIHLVLSGILAVFIGLMLFLIASMDNPFRGPGGISPDAYEIIQKSWEQSEL